MSLALFFPFCSVCLSLVSAALFFCFGRAVCALLCPRIAHMASDNFKKNQNDWEGAGKFLDETMRGGGGAYNSTLLLIRARCFQQRGQVNSIN